MATKSFDQLIDQIGNMTVLELSDLVKALEDKFGVSAAAPMAAAPAVSQGAAPEAAKAEEKSEYKVEIKVPASANKVNVIKALRQADSTLGLGEAKAKAEEAANGFVTVKEGVAVADAKKMKEVLEAAGAEVKLS